MDSPVRTMMNRSNSYDLDDVSLSKALESPDIRDAEEEARKRHFSDNYSPMFVSLRPSEEYNLQMIPPRGSVPDKCEGVFIYNKELSHSSIIMPLTFFLIGILMCIYFALQSLQYGSGELSFLPAFLGIVIAVSAGMFFRNYFKRPHKYHFREGYVDYYFADCLFMRPMTKVPLDHIHPPSVEYSEREWIDRDTGQHMCRGSFKLFVTIVDTGFTNDVELCFFSNDSKYMPYNAARFIKFNDTMNKLASVFRKTYNRGDIQFILRGFSMAAGVPDRFQPVPMKEAEVEADPDIV